MAVDKCLDFLLEKSLADVKKARNEKSNDLADYCTHFMDTYRLAKYYFNDQRLKPYMDKYMDVMK